MFSKREARSSVGHQTEPRTRCTLARVYGVCGHRKIKQGSKLVAFSRRTAKCEPVSSPAKALSFCLDLQPAWCAAGRATAVAFEEGNRLTRVSRAPEVRMPKSIKLPRYPRARFYLRRCCDDLRLADSNGDKNCHSRSPGLFEPVSELKCSENGR